MPILYLRFFFLLLIYTLLTSSCWSGGREDNTFQLYHYNKTGDSVTIAAGKEYKKSCLHNFLFGKHYRDLWTMPVKVPVLDLDSTHGGFTIDKKGGHFQTLNLHLQNNSNGREYVIRSLDKNQTQLLSKPLQKTFISRFFSDQTSALNPYGAIAVASLAQEAGIYHTNPKAYFLPSTNKLGEYQRKYGNQMYLLEEFPNESWLDTSVFNYPDDIVNTEHVLKKRYKKQGVYFDYLLYAKCRLFDVLIGDWDRHTGQWKWAKYVTDSGSVYKPIPRDRDAAFCRFNDGVITKLLILFYPKFQTFDHTIHLGAMLKYRKYLDNLILPALTKEEWIVLANSIKDSLTDKKIQMALHALPPEVYKKAGNKTAALLKSRRDQLDKIATEFYHIVAKDVKLIGTDENEQVVINRLNNKQTLVTIYNEDKTDTLFQRTFKNDETEKITIYTLNGNDNFYITGTVNSSITLQLYGGEGEDKYEDGSLVKRFAKKTIVYDNPIGNVFNTDEETVLKLSNNPDILDIDRVGEGK